MRIAVTGAGGRLGGQVVDLLAESHEVVALARREIPTDRHVSVAVADYGDVAALRGAMSGVDTLVFVTSDGEATQVVLHHQNVVRAAAEGGVAHIVGLSSLDADPSSPFCYAAINAYTEQLLHDSGCSLSIARASIYTEFFMRWLTRARASGQIRLPAADGRISLVSRTDVGRCLAALALSGPTGRHHDITGPEALDLHTIAVLTGHEYVDLTPVDHRIEMAQRGEDAWWMYAFSSMFDSVREQRWASVTDEVLHLTGRRPRSLRDVLATQLAQ